MRDSQPIVIGLTGSIGMGKSTTAEMFKAEGVPVWDADSTVHRLYSSDAGAIAAISKICPKATTSGIVDREILKDWIKKTPMGLQQLEQIVHPLVAQDRQKFLETNPAQIIVLDVPLLFETGLNTSVDFVVVVSVPADVQRARVLARSNMTVAQFESILAKQIPDADKRAQADFVIDTSSIDMAKAAVLEILNTVRSNQQETPDA
ncbi:MULTISPECIES: dephospho-CoA kinase [Pacificibacter]|uniref:dephospho-CoA kinase n=1 Tax=Pacificibacter TaxID=1042323 RepID=UPI001C09B5BF|nr:MULTISPECIES: dephospho-CoA kinase [Pacificibacter]MBU2936154.1 dephospho-CoA kinase [Pacificibacter marinus]MDO6614996.1 dephospho-CoA kinase [Pacificibacter sp. 1_MG-2023]